MGDPCTGADRTEQKQPVWVVLVLDSSGFKDTHVIARYVDATVLNW
jgi:hypothetical protein